MIQKASISHCVFHPLLLLLVMMLETLVSTAFAEESRNPSVPVLHEKLTQFAPQPQQFDWFGYSMDVDGNTLVVGAKGENQFTGAVYVYHTQSGNWQDMILAAKLTASDGKMDDQFGHDVAVSGGTIVVGVYDNHHPGKAYIFAKPESGWHDMQETAILSHPDSKQEDYFGASVEIDQDTVVIGAYSENENKGAVYIYHNMNKDWSRLDLMTVLTKPTNPGEFIYPNFGYSLALENEILVIGCYDNRSHQVAYVSNKPPTGWQNAQLDAELSHQDGSSGDGFGVDVAIFKNTIVVGANRVNGIEANCGAAYVFQKPPQGWKGSIRQTAKLIPSKAGYFANFGTTVSISEKGITLGGFHNNWDDKMYSGSVYLYEKSQSGWKDSIESKVLINKELSANDHLGFSTCMQGKYVFTGSYQTDEFVQDCGAVYLFDATLSGKEEYTNLELEESFNKQNTDISELPFQSNRLTFHHYDVVDGLYNLPIHHILEDQSGYMWFASDSSLCRFNGYSFQYTGSELLMDHSFSETHINCLYEDNRGQLWVGTSDGLVVIDQWRTSVKTISTESHSDLASNEILSLVEDQFGIMWIGTHLGLQKFNSLNEQVVPFQVEEFNSNTIPSIPIVDLKIDQGGMIWIAFGESFFCTYDPIIKKTTFFYSSRYGHDSFSLLQPLPSISKLHPQAKKINVPFQSKISQILPLSNDRIWLFSNPEPAWGNTIVEMHAGNHQPKLFPTEINRSYDTFLYGYNSIMEDQSGELWFGNVKSGLFRIHPKTNQKVFENHDPYRKNTIGDNTIHEMYEDSKDNVWISTNLSLDRVDRIGSRYKTTNEITNPLENSFTSICQDNNGDIWLGTSQGIISYNPLSSIQTNQVYKHDDPIFTYPTSLASDTNDNIWVGGYHSGISIFNSDSKTFGRIQYDPKLFEWRFLYLTSIRSLNPFNNILFFSTASSGLGMVDVVSNEVKFYYNREIGFQKMTDLLPIDHQKVYIGSENDGLFMVDSSKHNDITPIPYATRFKDWDQSKIYGSKINSIVKEPENYIWIGTDKALNMLNYNNGCVNIWRTDDGLTESEIISLQQGHEGEIWIAYAQNGVGKFDPLLLRQGNGEITNFHHREILLNAYLRDQCVVKQNGDVLFLTKNKIVEIEKRFQQPYSKTIPSTIQIESVLVNDVRLSLHDFSLQSPAKFDSHQNQFRITYSTLDYLSPDENVSRYRLIHNDNPDEWTPGKGYNQIQYRNLGAGIYRFEVEGRHPSGPWGSNHIKFIILPPFWQTGWFYAFSTLVIFIGGYFIYAIRVHQIKSHSRRLEKEVQVRTFDLEKEMEYSKQILDSSPTIIFRFTQNGMVEYINPSCESFLECSLNDIYGTKWWDVPAFKNDRLKLQKIHDEIHHFDVYDQKMDITLQSGKSCQLIWNFVNRYDLDGNVFETLAFGQDVTKQIEEEILKTSAREQRKIGREIHDSLCQTLAGITYMSESLLSNKSSWQEKEITIMEKLHENAQSATDQSRRIARALYLHELEANGLYHALLGLTNTIETMFAISCKLDCQVEIEMKDFEMSSQIYRIIQEALANAAKHSQASLIHVNIVETHRTYIFSIKDNGVGFKVNDSVTKSMGLRIMQHRAKSINAEFEIKSEVDSGSVITFSVQKKSSG